MKVAGKIIGYYADDGTPLVEELLSETFGGWADDRLKDLVEQGSVIPCGELPDDFESLEAWEESCDGLYPGYATETGTEQEARAYAALTEVLDEADPHQVYLLVSYRAWLAGNPEHGHASYYHDDRITALVMLLLHHGWTPPKYYAYTPMASRVKDAMPYPQVYPQVYPHDTEQVDYGQMMEELELTDP